MIDIKSLTIGQVEQVVAFATRFAPQVSEIGKGEINDFAIGKQVIIRTYNAGVWFGVLEQKAGREVILKNARRMWKWKAASSISLSACAVEGINRGESRIAQEVSSVWLEAIEIIPCTKKAAESIGGADVAAQS